MTKKRFAPTAGAVVCALGVLVLFGGLPPATGGTLTDAGIPLQVKQGGYCSVLAPADWTFNTNPQGTTAEAMSGDHTMYAAWSGAGINRAMQPYYGDLYGDPATSIRFIVGMMASGMGDPSAVRYTSAAQPFLNYFWLQSVESAQHAGVVFYHIYPGPTAQTYVESVYSSLAQKSLGRVGVAITAGVAVSFRCASQLVPVPYTPARPSAASKRQARAGCGHGGNLRGYQKELGTQYAHSPTTGQNFLLDPTTQWNETGPDGPGYYRTAGNSYEKLELGRDDDC